jgi:hypothetical protein
MLFNVPLLTLVADVWFYTPNQGAAIFFDIAFGLIAVGVTYRFFRGRGSRAFFITVMIGLVFEIVGFAMRAVARHRLDEVVWRYKSLRSYGQHNNLTMHHRHLLPSNNRSSSSHLFSSPLGTIWLSRGSSALSIPASRSN